MKKKIQKGLRMLPLLECEVIPITDPDEIAALERRIRAAEKAMAANGSNVKKMRKRK